MTRKEQNIIFDRQTGEDLYNTRADMYRAMLFGVRGVAIELGLIGED